MKLYLSFWSPIPILLILGLLFNMDLLVDMGTSKLSIGLLKLMVWYSAFLLFSGIGYYVFRGQDLNKTLKKLHWGPTLIGLLWFVLDALGIIGPGGSDMSAGVILLLGTGLTSYLVNMTVSILAMLLSK